MAYCDIDDVRLISPKRTYDASSNPTATQVTTLCASIANEMDAIISGRGITVPVTAPTEFLNALELINSYGAGALAEQGMFPEAGGLGMTPHGSDLWKKYQAGLNWLKTGNLPATLTEPGEVRGFFKEHGGTEPTEDEAWRRPKFGKNKEF